MPKEKKVDFCIECRKEVQYEIKREVQKEIIRGQEYEFILTKAYCRECGEEMSIPGLIDLNIKEREEQWKIYEN